VLGHDNLLVNLEQIRIAFEQTPESRAAYWLPPYHDMGLVAGIFEPVYTGYPCALMAPDSFLRRPACWLEAIDRYGATMSGAPNFAYDLCVRKTVPEERERLDLSSWTVAFNGAEPVRADTLNRFAAAFAVSRFRKRALVACYGLAEATLLVSAGAVAAEPTVRPVDRDTLSAGKLEPGDEALVACGAPAEGLVVAIVDPASASSVPDGTVGEIWVAGANVAHGYRNRPADPSFAARLPEHPGLTFLRTGDLGALIDGELVITGREKDLIVVRGRNVYPQDLERAAERAHPAIRAGGIAAFAEAERAAGDAQIAIVCELERGRTSVDADAVGRAVRRAVSERCEVAVATVVLIEAGRIPKTSSGKIRRRACAAALAAGALQAVGESRAAAPATDPPDRSQILAGSGRDRAALVAELVVAAAIRRGAPDADGTQSLLDVVTDSMNAVEVAADLHGALGVEVPLADILGDASIDELAARLAARLEEVAAPQPGVDPSVLSPGQAALWLVQKLVPSSSAYNLSIALRLHGRLDPRALARALAGVSARHAQLRVGVAADGGQLRFVDAPSPELVRIDVVAQENVAEIMTRIATAPFDLERGPLWRLAWLDGPTPTLLLCAHHVIADYDSLHVILDDLEQELQGGSLPPLRHGFAELVALESARDEAGQAEAKRSFWSAELADAPVLDLPSPGLRPVRATHRGSQHELVLPEDAVEALRRLARAEHTTPHAVMLAAFHALLHRWTGQEDIVIGTPVTGRRLPWTRDIVGYCVNPLPVRARPHSRRPFVELLREVRDRVVAGLAHELPFPSIVEATGGPRDPSRTLVFQALFALEKSHGGERDGILVPAAGGRIRFADLDAEPLLIRPSHVPFDVAMFVEQTASGFAVAVQVSHDALDGACAARLADQWVRLLTAAVRSPAEPVGLLPLLSAAEHEFVVHEANRAPATAAPPQDCLHTLVAQQAQRTPDAVALVDGHRTISYRELVQRASAVAHRLREHGVGPDMRVGLYLDRGAEMVVAVLGVLAAGGAYVYLDPRYPRDRVAFMIGDADMAVLLAQEHLLDQVPESAARLIALKRMAAADGAPLGFPDVDVRREHLAYVIYTSGSTGRPKGVAIEHRNAAALVGWAHGEYDPSLLRGTLAATSLAFDLSVFELFVPLSCGGAVIIADSALDLPRLPARDQVTLVNTVPSAMTELVAAGAVPTSVRVVNLAGEPLTAALAEAVHGLGHVTRVYNLYGPTEDTTYSTFERVERGATPTLGRPLANRATYVLDRLGQPVPVGVVGEICLGGEGVARGYLNRPELTLERFVPSTIPDAPGRLYWTGDLGRRLPDGRVEYLGRRDRQIKLRGFRVELEEIVAALVDDPTVADAAVIADDEQRLLAYVAAPDGADSTELRAYLDSRLPPFMVPNRITVLDQLPQTPNGKVDYGALSAVRPSQGVTVRMAPSNPTETELVDIWREVLGFEAGVSDDFFAVGGHSLLAIRVQARIRDRFGVDLPLPVMFEQRTIERLSQAIESGSAASLPRIRAVGRGSRRLADLTAEPRVAAGERESA
jgi:amino acid adenylation domain-containing protein